MQQVRTVAELAAIMRAARRQNAWTQAELADRAGVSRQWVVALESGQAARAELGRVLTVLAALNLPMSFPSLVSAPVPSPSPVTSADQIPAPPAPPSGTRSQPWLDLDAHLASFTRTDRRPQDQLTAHPRPGPGWPVP